MTLLGPSAGPRRSGDRHTPGRPRPIFLDLSDRGRSVTDRRRDTLDRIQADVTGGEDAGHRCRETEPVAGFHPLLAGENEAVIVPRDLSWQPVGPRCRPDENEGGRR